MKMSFMNTTWEKAREFGRNLAVSNVFLSAALLISVYTQSTNHERIVLTPPHVTERMSVGWNSADAEYLKSFGMYFALLTANVTPRNIDFVVNSLTTLVSPRIYPDVRKKLKTLAEDPLFKSQGGSVQFDITNVTYEPDTGKVFVTGELTQRSVLRRGEREPWVYEMKVSMVDGRPLVEALDSYQGNEPHTLKWFERHPSKTEAGEAAK